MRFGQGQSNIYRLPTRCGQQGKVICQSLSQRIYFTLRCLNLNNYYMNGTACSGPAVACMLQAFRRSATRYANFL